ncbi:RNA polymerase sigma factor [Moorella sp. Hama-1]|uniref:RNA polymerase sigma factor n=1 Tax=Moorella sp. Hama-1 TaxID=2138101 RepID=UPI00137A1EB0|nr:RNA polymerase sigma factor [Moorella sp. Hama-1]BCV23001.1 RNA polymerase sigma factor [Moorella sp. Hama-1]
MNLGEKEAPGKKNGAPSFEELVVTYQDRVYNLSYQLTGNHADAQDLAQEVFVRAYTGLARFRNEADPGTWLHRITVNLYLNLRRKITRHPVLSLDAPLDTGEGEVTREVAAGGDPQDVVATLELRQNVRHALRQLPADYQAVLILREMQGYSYDEIASFKPAGPGDEAQYLYSGPIATVQHHPGAVPGQSGPGECRRRPGGQGETPAGS